MSGQPRPTYRDIVVTIFFKTLPLVLITVVLFKFSRSSIHAVSVLPSFIYNAALILALLVIVKLTAGKLLAKLAAEGGNDPGQAAS